MKLEIFFVLTALLGIASCDLVCMQFKISPCLAVNAKRHGGDLICGGNTERLECIRNAARECDVESLPIVGEVIATYSETCKEGSEMNDLYKKHKTCVFHDAEYGNGLCMLPVLTEVLFLDFSSHTRSSQEIFLKMVCKHTETGNKCIDDNVKFICGVEASKFRTDLSDSSVRLSNQACAEVAAETRTGNNAIHYVHQRHEDHSVQAMAPHTQHLSAVGPQAGSIQIASTVAPRQYPEIVNGANINTSLQLICILAAAICMKCISPY